MIHKLAMRPLKIDDLDQIMTWVNDQEVIKNLQHFNKTFTRQEEEVYVKKILASKNDFVFSFFLKKGSIYIGQGGIHQISWENKLGRLSLIIKREHWDKGYAQEIIPLLIQYGFKQLGLHKIWLMHWRENKKAGYLYKKLGLHREGILRDEYFWQDHYHDMIRMAVINPA